MRTKAWLLALVALLPRPVRGEEELTLERAEAAFQAKRYSRACAMYRQLAKKLPEDAEVWSSLALCLHRLDPIKHDQEAVAAAKRAIEIGPEMVRKNAYFNLSLLGERVEMPTTGECRFVRSASCKARTLQVCGNTDRIGGNGGGETVTYLGIGLAVPDGGTPLTPRETTGDEIDGSWRSDAVELAIDQETTWTSRACSERGCPRREQLPEALQRYYDRALRKCVKAGRAEPECEEEVCQALQNPGPNAPRVVREYLEQQEKEHDACLEQWRKSVQEESDKPATYENCAVVSIEPCRGLIGVVCKDPGEETRVEELSMPRR